MHLIGCFNYVITTMSGENITSLRDLSKTMIFKLYADFFLAHLTTNSQTVHIGWEAAKVSICCVISVNKPQTMATEPVSRFPGFSRLTPTRIQLPIPQLDKHSLIGFFGIL
jgi:hypothetical protein